MSQIPDQGPEFIDGGSVYGEIFEHDLIKEVIKLKKNTVKTIINKAEHEGLVRKSLSKEEVEFSNTIIREIIYKKMLKKKVDFFRIKIAEAIISTKTQDVKKLHKAAMMYFYAEDKRALDLVSDISKIYLEKKEYKLLVDLLVHSFKMIKKKKLFTEAYTFIEYFSKINENITGELIDLVEEISFNVKDWNSNERILLVIADTVFLNYHKVPEKLLKKYVDLKGEDKYYLWTKVTTCKHTMERDDIVRIFKDLRDKFTDSEKLHFYMDYVTIAFFALGDLEMEKEGMEILLKNEKKMSDGEMVDFLLLKNTISMHRDDLKTSKKCLESLLKFPSRNPMERFTMLNDFAILYSNLAFKDLDPKQFKTALKYSIRSQKILIDHQKSAALPLITTNLAGFYLTSGKIKKAERAMLEGLYYGLAVDHYVEVPYTRTRIAFMTSASGAFDLSFKIGKKVAKDRKVTDLMPSAYILKYLYGGEKKEDIRTALKYAKEMLGFGTAKCYWEISTLRTMKALVDDDKKLLKILREDMIEWSKYPQRPIGKFSYDATIEILSILIGETKTDKKLRYYLKKLEKMNIKFGLRSYIHYAIGRLNKDIENLKLAKKYALKMKMYPFVLRIEKELFKLTKGKYWNNRIKLSEKKLEQMNKIKTIEEFLGYAKNNR